jgi:hypothetical protein
MIAAAPRYLAECYGGDIEALADVAGDFDAQSPEESTMFLLRQWTRDRRDRSASHASSPTPRPRSAAPASASSACTPQRSPPSSAGPPPRAARSHRRSPPRSDPPAPRSVTTCSRARRTAPREAVGDRRARREPPRAACFERGSSDHGQRPRLPGRRRRELLPRQSPRRQSAQHMRLGYPRDPVARHLSVGVRQQAAPHRPRPRLGRGAPVKPRRDRHAPRRRASGSRSATSSRTPPRSSRAIATTPAPPSSPSPSSRPGPKASPARWSARACSCTPTTAASTRPAPTRRSATSRRRPTTTSCTASPPSSRCAAPTPASPTSCRSSCAEHRPQPRSLPEPPHRRPPRTRPHRDPSVTHGPAEHQPPDVRAGPDEFVSPFPSNDSLLSGKYKALTRGTSKLSEELATMQQAKALTSPCRSYKRRAPPRPATC